MSWDLKSRAPGFCHELKVLLRSLSLRVILGIFIVLIYGIVFIRKVLALPGSGL